MVDRRTRSETANSSGETEKVEALTVKEAFDYWEKYYCIHGGLVKIKVNRRDFNNHIAPVLGNMIVDQTTKAHWLNLLMAWGEELSLVRCLD